jgi:chromosome segregation ATPase
MKTITIERMKIRQFKGIHSLDVDFGSETRITGDNGVGKTSINDAFNWCLYNKDSNGRSDFSVQPLSPDGNVKEKVETEVEVVLKVDGIDHAFMRTLSQDWKRPRGTDQSIMTGFTSKYCYNAVDVGMKEYKDRINDICPESTFSIITSVTQFCSDKFGNDNRRAVINQMANLGDVEDTVMSRYAELRQEYLKGKSIEQMKKELAMRKRTAETEYNQIPSRVDELERSKVDDNIDYAALREEISQLESELANIDRFLKGDESPLTRELTEFENVAAEIEASLNRQLTDKRYKILAEQKKAETDASLLQYDLNNLRRKIEELKKRYNEESDLFQKAVEKWKQVNETEYTDQLPEACETCHRPFSPEDLENMRSGSIEQWNQEKIRRLATIEERAKSHQAAMNQINEDLEKTESGLQEKEKAAEGQNRLIKQASDDLAQLPTLEAIKAGSREYKVVMEKILGCKEKIAEAKAKIGEGRIEEMLVRKSELEKEIKTKKETLLLEGANQRIDKRISELKDREKDLAQDIASVEQIADQIRQFKRAKVDLIDERISGLFRLVRFRMFVENLTNDGEKEVCEPMVNGTPYKDLNTAMQINAGIDICNALQKFYGVLAPIWIDRKESVVKMETTESQIIMLQVVEKEPLRIINK